MKCKNYKSNHALEILSMLNNDRNKMKDFCDVTLTAGSDQFAGHKCILGVFSTFFSKMFTIEMREKYENKGNVQEVNEETLEAVLNFIYTCDITITNENVYNLIEAANYMEIPYLKEFCVDFLLDETDVANCLHIRSYSKLYNLDKLIKKADFVIVNNFKSLIKEKEFMELKFKDFKEILEMEGQQITSEENVFYGMIEWIKHDVDARKQHLTELFSLLKLEKLSGDFLQDVVSQEELIMNCLECTKIIVRLTVSLIRVQQNIQQGIVQQQKKKKCFIALAGKQMWKYDVVKKDKHNLPNTLFDHCRGSAVVYKNKVYILNGENTDTMERFDLDNQSSGLKQLASTNVRKGNSASAVFDGCIYNCGGLDVQVSLLSGQRYNIDKNRWNRIPDMHKGRCNFALVSTSGGIYAIGGYDNGHYLNSVEHHDPRQGGWNIVHSMNISRGGLASVVLNDQLYAIGGYNNQNGALKSVERFDPRNQTWSNVGKMNYSRWLHGACVLKGKVYVAGGQSDAVEVYDPERNIWEIEANIPEFINVEVIVST